MPYYVSRYVGSGTHLDPFRPALKNMVKAHSIDLRPDPTQANGVAFCFSADDVSGPQITKIADDKLERLSTQINRRLYQELLISERATAADLQETIRALLVSPPPGTWKPLTRARGVLEIWLGGQLFWADGTPLPPLHGTINDAFTRANETPIAAPWVELSGSTGDINLSSNAITKSTTGDLFLYHNNGGSGWGADQSAKFRVATEVTNDDWGPAVRIGSNGFSGYWFSGFANGTIDKFVAGVASNVEDPAVTNQAANDTVKISIVGSTIRYYINDIEDDESPATDTSLATAGNGAGLFWYESGGSIDDAELTGENSSGGAYNAVPVLEYHLSLRRTGVFH